MIKSDKQQTEIKGSLETILIDYMHIIQTIIIAMRSSQIPDEIIEKQLVMCIAGGFEIADESRKEENDE